MREYRRMRSTTDGRVTLVGVFWIRVWINQWENGFVASVACSGWLARYTFIVCVRVRYVESLKNDC